MKPSPQVVPVTWKFPSQLKQQHPMQLLKPMQYTVTRQPCHIGRSVGVLLGGY